MAPARVQVIDDAAGSTLAATSTLNPEIRAALNGAGSNVEAAKMVGAKIAELCKQKNIEKVGVGCKGRRTCLQHGRACPQPASLQTPAALPDRQEVHQETQFVTHQEGGSSAEQRRQAGPQGSGGCLWQTALQRQAELEPSKS